MNKGQSRAASSDLCQIGRRRRRHERRGRTGGGRTAGVFAVDRRLLGCPSRPADRRRRLGSVDRPSSTVAEFVAEIGSDTRRLQLRHHRGSQGAQAMVPGRLPYRLLSSYLLLSNICFTFIIPRNGFDYLPCSVCDLDNVILG